MVMINQEQDRGLVVLQLPVGRPQETHLRLSTPSRRRGPSTDPDVLGPRRPRTQTVPPVGESTVFLVSTPEPLGSMKGRRKCLYDENRKEGKSIVTKEG